jgi:DnaJ-class molecular chaperone
MKRMFGNQFSKKSNVPNITITEECTLEELYNGKDYTKQIERVSLCKECNGFGTEDGMEHKCKDCGGSGMQIKVIKQGNMIQQMQQICMKCKGSGSDTTTSQCKKCNGKKAFKELSNISVKIPKGAYEGIGLEIENMGNEIPLQNRTNNKTRSSIIIKIKEKPHSTYVRGFTIPKYKENADPKDLKTTLKISLAESLTNFTKTLKFLDNKPITIFHEKIIKHGDVLVLPNNGMPILENNSQKGNLYITFEIEYPESISNNTKKILWQLFTNTPYKDTNYSVSNSYNLELPDKYKFDRNPRVPPGYGQNHNHNDDSDSDMNEGPNMFGGAPPDCKVQ